MIRFILSTVLAFSLSANVPPPKVAKLELHTQVDFLSAAVLINGIRANQDADSIVLDIDTPGGFVDAGWGIVKAIEASTVPVTCIVSNGMAASMGSVILQACGHRVMVDGISVIMIHALQGGVEGTPDEVLARGAEMKAMDEELLNYEVRRTRVTAAFIRKLIPGTKMLWIDARQAMAWGFVDEVILRDTYP